MVCQRNTAQIVRALLSFGKLEPAVHIVDVVHGPCGADAPPAQLEMREGIVTGDLAVFRFLCRCFPGAGLLGNTLVEQAQVETWLGVIADLTASVDPKINDQQQQELLALPLQHIENTLSNHLGFLVRNTLTLADVLLFFFLNRLHQGKRDKLLLATRTWFGRCAHLQNTDKQTKTAAATAAESPQNSRIRGAFIALVWSLTKHSANDDLRDLSMTLARGFCQCEQTQATLSQMLVDFVRSKAASSSSPIMSYLRKLCENEKLYAKDPVAIASIITEHEGESISWLLVPCAIIGLRYFSDIKKAASNARMFAEIISADRGVIGSCVCFAMCVALLVSRTRDNAHVVMQEAFEIAVLEETCGKGELLSDYPDITFHLHSHTFASSLEELELDDDEKQNNIAKALGAAGFALLHNRVETALCLSDVAGMGMGALSAAETVEWESFDEMMKGDENVSPPIGQPLIDDDDDDFGFGFGNPSSNVQPIVIMVGDGSDESNVDDILNKQLALMQQRIVELAGGDQNAVQEPMTLDTIMHNDRPASSVDGVLQESVELVCSGGGNVSVNAAAVAAILGAYLGYQGLPSDWMEGMPGGHELLQHADMLASVSI